MLSSRQANTTANSLPSTLASGVPDTVAAFTFQPVSKEDVFKVLRTMDVTRPQEPMQTTFLQRF